MPLTVQSVYGLTYDEVSGIIGSPYGFLFSQLSGESQTLAPGGGTVIIAGIDESDYPNAFDHIVQVFSSLGSGAGQGGDTVTGISADDKGKLIYLDTGVEKNALDYGVRIACDLTTNATYFIVLQLGNNIPGEIPFFNGTPPPPNKTSTPTVTTPASDDEWGFTTISWTTPDDLDTEVMGFRIWTYANYPGAIAYVVGTVPALSATHPNYSFTYAIGANEWPSATDEYRFTVEPYIFDPPPLNDPPTGTLGEESDQSDPIIYFPDGSPPVPPEEVEPDIELPPVDPETGLPIPGVPVDPDVDPDSPTESEEINPDTNEPYPAGTLKGTGYGGFNLGGSSLDNAAFMMNVSGIYTLVEGKLHDTLYERMTGITVHDVKIPDPFAKTGFI